jgi:SAM-dependent methyltransferase
VNAPLDNRPLATGSEAVDWAALYDGHPEYKSRRNVDSWEQAQIDLEVRLFKVPHLAALLGGEPARSLIEIGCATGELTAAFPVLPGGSRVGLDISPLNVLAARTRFGDCRFEAGDFRELSLPHADVVLLSDVLEHVPDDAGFLADAARLGDRVLVNLPLECNWLNRWRRYGADDVSGHLRAYDVQDGLALFERAGLRLLRWQQVWIHETAAEPARRQLRHQRMGQAYAGGRLGRSLRGAVFFAASAVGPLGRRLFASNLFALARPTA